jgi:RNA polymerase sigma-70 factor (ECF subfamily)
MKGRNEAFERAFSDYGDELFRHAFFRLSDREKAVDVVQETFLRAYGYAKTKEIGDLRSFLYRTLRNLIIDEYRRKKTASLDAMLEEESASDAILPVDETNTLHAAADRLDAADALKRVSELPPDYSEIILLRFVDGLTPKEMGVRLGISENLASVRVHRALHALRTLLTT